MKKLLLLTMLLLSTYVFGQSISTGSMWFDGMAQYRAEVRAGGQIVYFYGGTPHEGGYEFTLERVGKGKYKLIPSRQAEDYTPVGNLGSTVEHISRDGLNVLVVRSRGGLATHVLSFTVNECYDNIVLDCKSLFHGTYSEDQVGFLGHGISHVLDYEKCRMGRSGPMVPYEFMSQYDMPVNVIKASGKLWMLVPTPLGMNVYPAYVIEDEDYEKAGPATSVFWSEEKKGRFCIASERLLNTSLLGHYSKMALKLMRNEILARHGYNFQSEDLQDYFLKQSWYAPAPTNDNIKLSLIEELNISLIQAEEKKPDENRFPEMEED